MLPRKGVMMKGLVITTDSLMRTEEYTTPLHESIGKTVGGWIEVVHPKLLPAPYCMIVNEEGPVARSAGEPAREHSL